MNKKITRRNFLANATLAASATALFPRISLGASNKLVFYNWDTYIGENTLDQFKTATGIDTTMDLFADNSELFAKLRSGNQGYDVIVPSNDYVPRMIAANILQPIDLTKIPNISNIAKEWLNLSFDPNNQYSIPYLWGTLGMGYNNKRIDMVDSFKVILDSDKYSGRIAWISEASTMIDCAVKYLGGNPEEKTQQMIDEAEKLLKLQKKHIKVIAKDNGQDLLLSGEVDIAVEWSGDILTVMEEDDDLSYAAPLDGAFRWVDNMSIAKGAPNLENAHTFINFMLGDRIGADLADFVGYATPNAAARKLQDDEFNNNPARYPSAEIIDKLFFPIYQGEEISSAVERAWTRILAA